MSAAENEDVEEETPEADALETIIEAGRFQQTIDVLQSVADEAIFRLGRDGLNVRLVDPANVYMADVDVSESAFESVGGGQFAIGVNLERLNDILRKADSDDLVHFTLNLETRKLRVAFGNAEMDIAGIDPDSVRQEPDLPEMDLVNEFECEASHLKRANDIATLVSDHVKIEGDVDDECIRVAGGGDKDDARVELREELEWADVKENVYSKYSSGSSGSGRGSSTGYLSDALSVIPKDAEVTVRFGEEFPIFIEWRYADGDATVQQMIAPRVESL